MSVGAGASAGSEKTSGSSLSLTETAGTTDTSGVTSAQSPAAQILAKIGQMLVSETAGLRTGLMGTFEKLLKGQAPETAVPIIGRAVEASRRAGAKTLVETEEDLARSKLAGTPFGVARMAEARQNANYATGQTGPNILSGMLQSMFSTLPGFASSLTATGTSSLAQAIQGMITTLTQSKTEAAGTSKTAAQSTQKTKTAEAAGGIGK